MTLTMRTNIDFRPCEPAELLASMRACHDDPTRGRWDAVRTLSDRIEYVYEGPCPRTALDIDRLHSELEDCRNRVRSLCHRLGRLQDDEYLDEVAMFLGLEVGTLATESCNRHTDCVAARVKDPGTVCCHDECCEECFGY